MMRVTVTRADWRKAREVYRLFKAKPYSEHIASEFALAHLAAVLRTNDIKSVLEFGAGIGTATYLILSSRPDVRVEATERQALCLDALAENIPSEMRERLIVHSSKKPVAGTFDLVIIDGATDPSDLSMRSGAIVFAEGNRSKARAKFGGAAFTNYAQWRWWPQWRSWRGLPVPVCGSEGAGLGAIRPHR